MIAYQGQIEKQELGNGVILKDLGAGLNLNVLYWKVRDQNFLPPHQHPEEQFGYVIKGGFEITIDGESFIIKAGDAYFIPPHAVHSLRALGETEVIDAFSPVKTDMPWKK